MDSFLISSKDKIKLTEKWQEIVNKEKIGKFDVSLVESDKSIGIGDVREIQKRLFLKPLQSPKKAVIVDATLGITIEAQNALLKSLEEPPDNTIIILLVSNSEIVLPTIVSRCKVFDFNSSHNSIFGDKEKEDFEKMLGELEKATVADKLKMAQDFGKNKEDTALWSEKMILVIREKILKDEQGREELLNILKEFEKTNKVLKTSNANPRLALESLFFSI
jgi:DNA polymerase III delta prime subunit